MAHKIGQYSFDAMHGEPQPPMERLAILQRNDRDGTGLKKTGAKGQPFALRTITFLADRSLADERHRQYTQLAGEDPQTLIYGDVASEDRQYKVAVLDVRKLSNKQNETIVGAGGVSDGSSGAKLICQWTLIAISTEQEDE